MLVQLSSKAACLTRSSTHLFGRAWLSTRTPVIREQTITVAPLPHINEFQHLLENENEYGIAESLHMSHFSAEKYKFPLRMPDNIQHESPTVQAAAKLFVDTTFGLEGSGKWDQKLHPKTVDPTKIHEYKHNFDESEF